jgi:septum formation protein
MLQRPAPRLVLASASASRRSLLTAAGLDFAVRPADIDEAAVKSMARADGLDARQAALRLAELKAQRIAMDDPAALVIGADQILVCDAVWFDKPASTAAAREQLRALRGRGHVLATAVVCQQGEQCVWRHIAEPRLVMRNFSDEFLEEYLAQEGEDVTSTVGSYRLEGRGVHLFERIEGEHAAVLGLPLLSLLIFLRARGVVLS